MVMNVRFRMRTYDQLPPTAAFMQGKSNFFCVSVVEGNIRTAVWIKVIGVVYVDAYLVYLDAIRWDALVMIR